MFGAFGTLHAIKRLHRLANDYTWVDTAATYLDAAFNNPDLQSHDPFIKYLQVDANTRVRNTIADQIADRIEHFAKSENTGKAINESIIQLIESYSPLLVLFTDADQDNRFKGVRENANELLPLYFEQFNDVSRPKSDIFHEMGVKMQRHGFDFLLACKVKTAFEGAEDSKTIRELVTSSCRYHSGAMRLMLNKSESLEKEFEKLLNTRRVIQKSFLDAF